MLALIRRKMRGAALLLLHLAMYGRCMYTYVLLIFIRIRECSSNRAGVAKPYILPTELCMYVMHEVDNLTVRLARATSSVPGKLG